MQDFENKKVSVVTPFHNTGDNLRRCIESVIAQTHANFEYLLVDNCSMDSSPKIAQEYADRDERIRVLTNDEHLGTVAHINNALRQVSSDSAYCKIVQEHDWLYPNCLSEMVGVAEQFPTVGVVGAYGSTGDDVYLDGLPYPSTCVAGTEACRQFLSNRVYLFGSPTSLLYRAEIVRKNNPFFNEHSPIEDAESGFRLLQQCDFGFVHQVLTFTNTEVESATAFVKPHSPRVLAELVCCEKYGAVHLSRDEQQNRRAALQKEYFQFLGESVLRRRSEMFWRYQRETMQSIGLDFDTVRKTKYTLLAVLELALNPKSTLERLLDLKQRKSSLMGD